MVAVGGLKALSHVPTSTWASTIVTVPSGVLHTTGGLSQGYNRSSTILTCQSSSRSRRCSEISLYLGFSFRRNVSRGHFTAFLPTRPPKTSMEALLLSTISLTFPKKA